MLSAFPVCRLTKLEHSLTIYSGVGNNKDNYMQKYYEVLVHQTSKPVGNSKENYTTFNQEKHQFANIQEAKEWLKLYHAMKGLRGDWSEKRDSPYLKLIYELIPKTKEENLVPKEWADAVKDNADSFDGHFCDGRIMRDGALRTSSIIEKIFEESEIVEEIPEMVSGNMAKMFGAKKVLRKGGYRGSYTELFEEILDPEMKLEACARIHNPPSFFYTDEDGYI